jgi:hypothetical protein
MVQNKVTFFHPCDSSIAARAPKLLDGMLTRSREVIITNMKQLVSLTLGILKSLYPQPDLYVVGGGFTARCTDKEASKSMEDSALRWTMS